MFDAVFREEWGRVTAALTRRFGSLDLAEEATQEACALAVVHWAEHGVPPNPGGWLMTAARNRALDVLRREASRGEREQQAQILFLDRGEENPAQIEDDLLRLMFTCCHPSLALESRVALTLRLVAGLHAREIARAFLVSESAMRQRLTRAKRELGIDGIPWHVPEGEDLPLRLHSVCKAVYLVFNAGYTHPESAGLCDEGIRLARLLVHLLPDAPEARGLLGMLLLIHARRDARLVEGRLVPLPEQDRRRWDLPMVREGQALVRQCLAIGRPGPFQLDAAVQAVHSDAPVATATAWDQIVALYDQRLLHGEDPVVRLNRAVAVGQLGGPDAALAQLEAHPLEGYGPWHVVRAELLDQLGRAADATDALEHAVATLPDGPEREHLRSKLEAR